MSRPNHKTEKASSHFPIQDTHIDRKVLPVNKQHNQDSAGAARDNIEQQLMLIWVKLLEVKLIGIQDDFFKLGGDSMIAVRTLVLSGFLVTRHSTRNIVHIWEGFMYGARDIFESRAFL
jgi:hypothetical protein